MTNYEQNVLMYNVDMHKNILLKLFSLVFIPLLATLVAVNNPCSEIAINAN